MPLYRGFPR